MDYCWKIDVTEPCRLFVRKGEKTKTAKKKTIGVSVGSRHGSKDKSSKFGRGTDG